MRGRGSESGRAMVFDWFGAAWVGAAGCGLPTQTPRIYDLGHVYLGSFGGFSTFF